MTPFLWGLLAGITAVHIFWALAFGVFWWRIVRKSGDDVQQAIREDFATVRDALRRAERAGSD